MIQVNLIPDVKQELLRAQQQRNVVISVAILLSIAAGVIAVLVASYVFVAQAVLIDQANKSIDREYATLTQVEDLDKLLTIQNQLKKVSELNANKNAGSRLYGMLNVIVPAEPHEVAISSLMVVPLAGDDQGASADTDQSANATASGSQGATITIEGQTPGGYASLEVFEKTIAATVIEYRLQGAERTGDLNCGNPLKQCRYLAEGGGDRSQAIDVAEMGFGEDAEGRKILSFKLSFTVAPELLSNVATDVTLKVGINGNVTDSFLNAPRAIFRDRTDDGGGQ